MDYFEMITAIPAHRTALIEDSVHYTYGDMARDCEQRMAKLSAVSTRNSSSVVWIRPDSAYNQLVSFLACTHTGRVPVILPPDTKRLPDLSSDMQIPDQACMGVLTSGTTGLPRLWFRTFESWYGFFPVQNKIFDVSEDTRMFVHGSLAFTGNLNMYLALLSAGALLITCTPVHPPYWNQIIDREQANAVYLIPSKLRLLARTAATPSSHVRTILAGSQSMGAKDIQLLKQAFLHCRCTLYYGSSELSYVSYLHDQEMDKDPGCVGRPFPGVSITIEDNMIMADTPCCALGIPRPFSAGDMGYIDKRGYLHLLGRKDNVYNIHGRKVSALLVEHALTDLDEVQEAAVALEQGVLTAYVVPSPGFAPEEGRFSSAVRSGNIMELLKKTLESYELPRRICFCREIPKNSSGKPVLSLLALSITETNV